MCRQEPALLEEFAEEAEEKFQEQTGVKTQTSQLDVTETVSGDSGLSAIDLNGSPHTLTVNGKRDYTMTSTTGVGTKVVCFYKMATSFV